MAGGKTLGGKMLPTVRKFTACIGTNFSDYIIILYEPIHVI